MISDPPSVAGPEPPDQGAAPLRNRVRIRFEKAGNLRFVSHHDLMHCFERMLRRANLPVQSSQGFHPKPRMVFALSLALGLVGREEVLDLELDESRSPAEVEQALRPQAPPGLRILAVTAIDPRTRIQVRRAFYRVEIPSGRRADLAAGIDRLLEAPACWIERTRPQPRRLDLRPYICGLCLDGDFLEMALWVTPNGAARPEEILRLLGLADLVDAAVLIERTHLELHDEVSNTSVNEPSRMREFAPVPPQSASPPAGAAAGDEPVPPAPGARKKAGQTLLIPGPMSFDS